MNDLRKEFKTNAKRGSILVAMIKEKNEVPRDLEINKEQELLFWTENGFPAYLSVQQMPRLLIILFLLESRAVESTCSFQYNPQEII